MTEFRPNYVNLKDCFMEVIEELTNPPVGISLRGLRSLNTLMGGIREKEFTILCGATGTGKTTLLSNISTDLLLQGIPHYVASVETGYKDFVKRILSILAEENMNMGNKVAEEKIYRVFDKYKEYIKESQAYFSLYENRIPVETLLGELKYMITHHGIKIAMLDNLNFFLEITCASDSIVEMDRVIHEFILFCKQNPIHIIMVMHPKKTENGRVESEFDIKGSSTAVQEAHNVLLFNRPTKQSIEANLATKYDREIMLAKSRTWGHEVGKRFLLIGKHGIKYEDGKVYEL